MRQHIRQAKKATRDTGYIGVNVLFAMNDFAEKMKAALEEKVDFIISGAGISRDMYAWGREAGIPVLSIVSSAKLARISERLGAAAVVVEGFEAGGHLGTDRPMFDILPEVVEAVKIPVIAAGGILTGEDIAKALDMGASGVQMGIRFVASNECDAPEAMKQKYIHASSNDTLLLKTTVGLPGRMIANSFTDVLMNQEKVKIKNCQNCLKSCSHRFCLLDSLFTTIDGDVENGIIFAGSRVNEIKEILPIERIMANLTAEYIATMNQSEAAFA